MPLHFSNCSALLRCQMAQLVAEEITYRDLTGMELSIPYNSKPFIFDSFHVHSFFLLLFPVFKHILISIGTTVVRLVNNHQISIGFGFHHAECLYRRYLD